MCDMCVETHQGTHHPLEHYRHSSHLTQVLEHDSAMKDGQHVKNAQSQGANVQATPASFSLGTKW